MVNDTNSIIDPQLKTRIDAYNRVVSAWNWIRRLAEKDKYYDEYILAIFTTKEVGVMPIAEILMCLVNTKEEDYQRLGLPKPSPDIIVKVTNKLLHTYEIKKFSGIPYLRSPDPKLDPPFTDAVCYTAGALSSILKLKELSLNNGLRKKCKNLLITCLDWLLQAGINAEKWKDVECMKTVRGAGWSWSSPIEIAKDEKFKNAFGKYLPPQTYFTSQVLTTLQEIFFDHYNQVEEKNKLFL